MACFEFVTVSIAQLNLFALLGSQLITDTLKQGQTKAAQPQTENTREQCTPGCDRPTGWIMGWSPVNWSLQLFCSSAKLMLMLGAFMSRAYHSLLIARWAHRHGLISLSVCVLVSCTLIVNVATRLCSLLPKVAHSTHNFNQLWLIQILAFAGEIPQQFRYPLLRLGCSCQLNGPAFLFDTLQVHAIRYLCDQLPMMHRCIPVRLQIFNCRLPRLQCLNFSAQTGNVFDFLCLIADWLVPAADFLPAARPPDFETTTEPASNDAPSKAATAT